MENPELNVFRRLGARFMAGAYVEGWGLYAERLADELGLYRNDGERLGMLDAQAWRASRLIVDSGMHGLGWSRQRSIDWLLKTGLSETDAVIETDRYIAWPGQALSYMAGMREIRRLRQELEARDGDRFDLTGFHDQLIGHGSLPLVTLAAELPGWVSPGLSRPRPPASARPRRASPAHAAPTPPALARAGGRGPGVAHNGAPADASMAVEQDGRP